MHISCSEPGIYLYHDHRILGDSAFVMEVLAEAEEKFERFYELLRNLIINGLFLI